MKNFIFISYTALISLLLITCTSTNNNNKNWLQYRADSGRSGYTPQHISENMSPKWIHILEPSDRSWTGIHTRMTFDHALQPVIKNNTLFVGNSNDNQIYAINTKTGEIKWKYFTDGPVRFAPAIYKNKIYAVSDDGYIYCLASETGNLKWKKYGGQRKDMIIGNGKMIARWPARGGPVIDNGVLYFGSGIWPSEKIFIYALNPDNGEVLWVNDSSGEMKMPQPHGGAVAESGLSAQGYLASGADKLFIPTGRAVPAALDSKSGEFLYFHLQKYRNMGGSDVIVSDSLIFIPSGNTRDLNETKGRCYSIFNSSDGEIIPGEIKSEAVAITPEYIYAVNNETHQVEAYSKKNLITTRETTDRRGNKTVVKELSGPTWSSGVLKDHVKTLIATKNRLIAGTATNKILILDIQNGRLISSYNVNGVPLGLAIAQNSLFVSTDLGYLYCFESGYKGNTKIFANDISKDITSIDSKYADAADEIIEKSGVKSGYCLDLDCGDGSLVYEIAKKTNLKIVALSNNKNNVDKIRQFLDDAGLYGSRAVVFHGDINSIPLPDYFANLIISQESLFSNGLNDVDNNIKRCQKPCGGVVIKGITGKITTNVRGELRGAGQWTHQYHDPANTTISEDQIVNGKLEMLWFKDSDFDMPSRHGRGVAPLYKNGKLFVEGNDAIRAVDAYNGNILWEYFIEDLMSAYDQEHIMGTAITHGNWCIEGDRLFVRRGVSMYNRSAKDCYALDINTGYKVATYNAPEGYWGYLATQNGILYGTVANEKHIVRWGYQESDMFGQFSESNSLFALDIKTGEPLWEYKALHSIRHNTIAIGNDKVYLIDRPVADMDYIYRGEKLKPMAPGVLVVLDAKTGKILLRNNNNIWGTLLILNEKRDRLIMSYNDTRYKLPSEKGGKIAVLDASTGNILWEAETRQNLPESYASTSRSRPLVNDSIIFAEPETFDLFTGKVIDNNFERSYGCGIISGSKKMLFFRSATVGYYLFDDISSGIHNYGGIRPGCWINMIPAGGLVLMPDATNRCDCSYLMKSWIALKPMKNL